MIKINKNISLKLTEANIILTFLIVWLHVSALYTVPQWITDIAIPAVPCFFSISAFLYFYNFDFDNPFSSWKNKIKARFFSLFLPFIIFNLFGFIFSYIASLAFETSLSPINDDSNIIHDLYSSKFNGPLWYLRALFEFALIAPIIGIVAKFSFKSIFLIIPLAFLGYQCSYFSFGYWIVEIFMGIYFAIYWDNIMRIIEIFKLKKYINFITILISCCIVFLYLYNTSNLSIYMIRLLSPIYLIGLLSIKSSTILSEKIIISIGSFTMLIYCLHQPLSRITSKFSFLTGISNQIILDFIGTSLTIALIIGIGTIIKKNKSVWSLLTGGR